MKRRKHKVVRINGYHPTGVRRLIDALLTGVTVSDGFDRFRNEMPLNDIEKLITMTRCRIAEEWKGYRPGLRTALKVFDDLCGEYYDSEIASEHGTGRERIRQLHEKLLKLPCMRRLKRKLKALQSGDDD